MSYSPETLKAITENQTTFVWEIPEFIEYERSKYWYLILSLISIGSVVYAIYSLNYLFSLIILISSLVLLISTEQKPRKILVQIGDNGIVIDGKLIEYNKLHNFSIIYQPPYTKLLYIERKSFIKPRIKLFLENEDPIAIREHLLQYLEENLDLQEEHFSDILGRLFKI